MTSSTKNKKNISLKSLIDKINSFRRSISHDVFLVEFDKNSLNIANAFFKNNKINISKVRRIDLPEKAIEKSIPSDPVLMAEFLKDIIEEEKINTRRISIMISTDAIYTRLINIPSEFSLKDSYQYVANPNSGLQIPIPVQNIDFDLLDTNTFTEDKLHKKYLLVAAPKKSINTILETTKNLGFKVCNLESIIFSQLRLISSQISKLGKNNFILLVDLTPDCTYLVCVTNKGPFHFDRLASIRNYSTNKPNKNVKNNSKKENDSLLPISKLDLKILFKEITISLKNITSNKSYENFSIFLTGHNSLHSNIKETFEEYFKTKVEKINAFNSSSIGNIDYDAASISENTISKLVGLALGLNSSEGEIFEENESILDVDKQEKTKLDEENVTNPTPNFLRKSEKSIKQNIKVKNLEKKEFKDLTSLKTKEKTNTNEIIQNALENAKELEIDKLTSDNTKLANSKNSLDENASKRDSKGFKKNLKVISSSESKKKKIESDQFKNKEENLFKGLNISQDNSKSQLENDKKRLNNTDKINNDLESKKPYKKSKNEFKIDPDLIDLD